MPPTNPQDVFVMESLALSGIGVSMPPEDLLALRLQANLLRIDAGIGDLRRLPWAAGTVPALNLQLAQIKALTDNQQAFDATERMLKTIETTRKQAQAALKQEQKAARKRAKAERRAAADKIAYDAAREEVFALLQEIEADPFVQGLGDLGHQLSQVRKNIGSADELLGSDAGAAIKAMLQCKSDCKSIAKQRGKILKAMRSKHRALISTATQLSDQIGAAKVLSQEETTRLQNTVSSYVNALAGSPTDKKMAREVEQALGELSGEVAQIIKQRQSAQTEAAKVVIPAVTQARDLLKYALNNEVVGQTRIVDVLQKADTAERMLNQNHYTPASELAGELQKQVPDLRDALLLAKSTWEGASGERSADRQALIEQKELQKSGDFLFGNDPGALLSEMLAIPPKVMVSYSYAAATAAMADVHAMVAANTKQREDWTSLGPTRGEEQEKFNQAFKEAQEAIEALAAAMVNEVGEDGWVPFDVGGLQSQLDEIYAGWQDLCKRATDETDMDASVSVMMLSVLQREAERMGGSEGALKEAIDNDAFARAQDAYTTARDALVAAIPGWDRYPLDALPSVRSELSETQALLASAATVDDLAALTKRLERVEGTAKAEAFALEKTLEAERGNLDKRLLAARKTIGTLKKKAAKKKRGIGASAINKTRERCGQEAVRLEEQLAVVAGRRSSNVVDLVIEAIRQMYDIEERCKALLGLCAGKKETVPLLPDTFAQVVKANRALLNHKALKKFRPSDRLILERKLDAIADRLGKGEHTSRIQKSLDEWTNEHAEVSAKVERDQKQKDEFDELHKQTKQLLTDNASLFVGYEKFLADLEGKLSSAKTQSEEEDGVNSAVGSLLNVKTTLERLVQSSTEDSGGLREQLKNGEASAQAAEDRSKEQKKTWEARLRAFEDRWLTKISSNPRKADVDALLKQAKKSAGGKAPDYDTANRYLEMAAQRAMLIIEFPDGPVATSLSRLPGEEQKWRQAVGAYKDSFAGLRDHFSSQQPPARKALTDGVDELKRSFDPEAFASYVQRICLKNADPSDRSAAREAALGVVRRYRDELVRDPRFQLLSTHPFQKAGVSAWNGHLTIQRQLIELERLLLMAVPTA